MVGRLDGGEVDREWVHAVDLPARQTEAGAAPRESGVTCHLVDVRRDGVQVVLDEEAQRQVPRGREIEGLQRRPDVRRSVAEVRHRDVVGPRVPVRPRGAGGQRHPASDNGVRADRSRLVPLQVHRSAATVTESPVEPGDLSERLEHDVADGRWDLGRRVYPVGRDVLEDLREKLVMSAVGAIDRVAGDERED